MAGIGDVQPKSIQAPGTLAATIQPLNYSDAANAVTTLADSVRNNLISSQDIVARWKAQGTVDAQNKAAKQQAQEYNSPLATAARQSQLRATGAAAEWAAGSVGGEELMKTAVNQDGGPVRNPDGSVNFDATKERGADITNAQTNLSVAMAGIRKHQVPDGFKNGVPTAHWENDLGQLVQAPTFNPKTNQVEEDSITIGHRKDMSKWWGVIHTRPGAVNADRQQNDSGAAGPEAMFTPTPTSPSAPAGAGAVDVVPNTTPGVPSSPVTQATAADVVPFTPPTLAPPPPTGVTDQLSTPQALWGGSVSAQENRDTATDFYRQFRANNPYTPVSAPSTTFTTDKDHITVQPRTQNPATAPGYAQKPVIQPATPYDSFQIGAPPAGYFFTPEAKITSMHEKIPYQAWVNKQAVIKRFRDTASSYTGKPGETTTQTDLDLANAVMALNAPGQSGGGRNMGDYKVDRLEDTQPLLEQIHGIGKTVLKTHRFAPETRNRIIAAGERAVSAFEDGARGPIQTALSQFTQQGQQPTGLDPADYELVNRGASPTVGGAPAQQQPAGTVTLNGKPYMLWHK